MAKTKKNKTVLVKSPGTEEVALVIAIVLDAGDLDLERHLSGIIPEMARGGVRGGLLVVGDSTLVLRNTAREVLVDEVETERLLGLAGLDGTWDPATIVATVESWIATMARGWRDRLDPPMKKLLVPHVVSGLGGEVVVVDGIWGTEARRVATLS
jgi:hypothetical protein